MKNKIILHRAYGAERDTAEAEPLPPNGGIDVSI